MTIAQTAIRRASTALLELAREHDPKAWIHSYGAIELDPGLLAFWIGVATDDMRDQLKSDARLRARMTRALRESGYPAEALARVVVGVESQETVDREYEGNWRWAMQ